MSEPHSLKYPLGPLELPDKVSVSYREGRIHVIQVTPRILRQVVRGLSAAQLDTPYRPGGWTVRQLVHHIADSHLNAYIRFRWALTEDSPKIKAYDQDEWACLPDACEGPLEDSLALLDALHSRWCRLMRAMKDKDWKRQVHHPEDGIRSCQDFLIIYAWHGLHHIAHIVCLRDREGWWYKGWNRS